MTEVGQYVYLPEWIEGPGRLAPFARLYIHSVASYWRKPDFDLGDLPVIPYYQLHLDRHRWGEWS